MEMLSTEKPKIIPHPVARIALPVVFGVMIEVACDLLRYVVRYFSTSIYFEVKLGLWEQLKDLDLWIGFAVMLVGIDICLGRMVRTGLLLISESWQESSIHLATSSGRNCWKRMEKLK